MYQQGEIVLVPVPFTDLTSQKRRPVIIISNEFYHQRTADIVVVAMTSNPLETPYSFTVTTSDLVKGQLNRPSKVRPDKIYTLSQTIVVCRFGQVSKAVLEKIRSSLQELTKV